MSTMAVYQLTCVLPSSTHMLVCIWDPPRPEEVSSKKPNVSGFLLHHDYGDSYKGKHLIVVAYSSEVQSIVIVVGHGGVQADMVLEKELRVLTS